MLSDLPLEIISTVVSYLPTAASVSSLSQTCRRLHAAVNKEGWRAFVHARFPSIPTDAPAVWVEAARSLTALSRSWDRQAFLAQYLQPPRPTLTYPHGTPYRQHARRQNQQTMGYRPVIDSYQEQIDHDWASRKEVVAWGAGSELIVRVKKMGNAALRKWKQTTTAAQRASFDQHGHHLDWMIFKDDQYREGVDDITSVNVLSPGQTSSTRDSSDTEDVIVGRASGDLSVLRLTSVENHRSIKVRKGFDTKKRDVQAATLSQAPDPLLAACLDYKSVAVYSVNSDSALVESLAELDIVTRARGDRTWSTKFLSPKSLAVGIGASTQPINVFSLTPSGIDSQPTRRFSANDAKVVVDGDLNSDVQSERAKGTSSVYALATVAPDSSAGGNIGDLFLSGWYDGICRLHDMRSPLANVASYIDPVDTCSTIYSLAVLGRERFVAGGARHSLLKVFDLRMTGGKSYYYTDVHPCRDVFSSQKASKRHQPTRYDCCPLHDKKKEKDDWNVFVHPQRRKHILGRACDRRAWGRPTFETPVYSLSSPSANSPTLFAGIENEVVEFNFVSVVEETRHPNPLYARTLTLAADDSAYRRKWDPYGAVLELAAYRQAPMHGMYLRHQMPVGALEPNVVSQDLDERWQ
ncbi:MAG: hypothetical protein M1833_004491 [Piccolia ochrophora]|nr:MAG: hypothetical protein M1833_004491 [Piccolia ochrophora]